MSETVQIETILEHAQCLYTLTEVELALNHMAQQISRDFAHKNPVVLGVMNGAIATLGYLLPRLAGVLEIDYVHATRYMGKEIGSQIIWKREPQVCLAGRHVLLVDDILDQGLTLAGIADYCHAAGALSVSVAVLGEKQLPMRSADIKANYIALKFPDRYVFGFGMDYQERWRNAPGIFAI